MSDFAVKIRRVEARDLGGVTAVLADWQSPDDVAHTLDQVRASLEPGNSRLFWVAEDRSGAIVGLMGLTGSDIDIALYATGERPAELISAYVAKVARGLGVGRALADAVETKARDDGYSRLIIVSGSRNRESGYPFWERRYGEPAQFDADFFGLGQERVVWSLDLAEL